MSVPHVKYCPRCQTQAPVHAAFCGQCGRQYQATFPGSAPDLNASAPAAKRSPVGLLIVLLVIIAIMTGAGTVVLLHRRGLTVQPEAPGQRTSTSSTASTAGATPATMGENSPGTAPANPAGPAAASTPLPVSGGAKEVATGSPQSPAPGGVQATPPAGAPGSGPDGAAAAGTDAATALNGPGSGSGVPSSGAAHDGAANVPPAGSKHETFRSDFSVHVAGVERSEAIPLITNRGQRVQDAAPRGDRFLICEVTIANHSDQAMRITPGSLAMIGSDSQFYTAEIIRFFRARPVDFRILDQTVPAGGEVNGKVVFMAPRAVKPAKIGVLAF